MKVFGTSSPGALGAPAPSGVARSPLEKRSVDEGDSVAGRRF
jgi:hypothetical protein